jgi:hypothetical protein
MICRLNGSTLVLPVTLMKTLIKNLQKLKNLTKIIAKTFSFLKLPNIFRKNFPH